MSAPYPTEEKGGMPQPGVQPQPAGQPYPAGQPVAMQPMAGGEQEKYAAAVVMCTFLLFCLVFWIVCLRFFTSSFFLFKKFTITNI